MTTPPEDFLHAWMRRVEAKLDQAIEDNREFRARIGNLEGSVADMNSHVHSQSAEQSLRMDKIIVRLERIERRLDLTEAKA